MASGDIFPATGMPDRDWWQALWPEPETVLSDIGIESWMTVVDLCCGDGYFTAPLAKLTEGKVYAVDLDPSLLEAARAEVERAQATVREWYCDDAREIASLVPERVDYVLIANTFHGVPDKSELAREVRKILQTHGRFGIINWHLRPREQTRVLGTARGPKSELRMSVEETQAEVIPAGFNLDRLVELPPYHYCAIFGRILG